MNYGDILVCLAEKAGRHSGATPDIGVILLKVGASVRRIGEFILPPGFPVVPHYFNFASAEFYTKVKYAVKTSQHIFSS